MGLRAYGQRDPLVEYKNEAFTLFADLMDRIKGEIAGRIFRATTSPQAYRTFTGRSASACGQVKTQHADTAPLAGGHAAGGGGRRGGGSGAADAGAEAAMNAALAGAGTVARNAQGRARSVPVRQREEIQVLRERRREMDECVILKGHQHGLRRDRIAHEALQVLTRLDETGYKAYLCGGGVRDLLLGAHAQGFRHRHRRASGGRSKDLPQLPDHRAARFKLAHVAGYAT